MSPRRAHVITASNRAAAGVYPDRGGPLIVEWLRARISEAHHTGMSEVTRRLETDAKAVTILTVHRSKGLEFPMVFVCGMEDGLFPHQRSVNDVGGLEEERRLCYVGATRAMRQLYLTYAEQRRLHGVDSYGVPSRFIKEIPSSLIEEVRPRMHVSRPMYVPRQGMMQEEQQSSGMRLGQRVKHGKFGEGVILDIEGQGTHARVQVNFEQQGPPKWLMLAYANLEPV